MNNLKCSPGPWKAFNNHHINGVIGVSGLRSDVCWTRIEDGNWFDGARKIEEDVANACAIAAVHELYDACEAAIEVLRALGQAKGGTYEALLRATAKARGEQR